MRESGGLVLRIRPTGSKPWLYQYDLDGKRYNLTLGTYPELSLKEARLARNKAKQLLVKGTNPVEAKRDEKAQEQARFLAPTVADLADKFITEYVIPRKCSAKEDIRILNKDVIPALGKIKLEDLTRRQIVVMLERVAKRGGIMGNCTLAVTRRMFNFAVGRGLLENSPATHIKPLACVFHAIAATDSIAKLPPIPRESGH